MRVSYRRAETQDDHPRTNLFLLGILDPVLDDAQRHPLLLILSPDPTFGLVLIQPQIGSEQRLPLLPPFPLERFTVRLERTRSGSIPYGRIVRPLRVVAGGPAVPSQSGVTLTDVERDGHIVVEILTESTGSERGGSESGRTGDVSTTKDRTLGSVVEENGDRAMMTNNRDRGFDRYEIMQ
jgi:hypothetical protein